MKFRLAILVLPLVVFASLLPFLFGRRPLADVVQVGFSSDTQLYLAMIQRASSEGGAGDPFLVEHGASPAISELNNDWVVLLGRICSFAGLRGVLFLLIPFYAFWIFSLWNIHCRCGVPKGPALFSTVLLANIVIGIAGGVQGFHTLAWIRVIPWEDFWRLYPSTISMAVYAFAILATLRLWERESISIPAALFTGACSGIVIYGRPFDWMVACTFLGLLFLLAVTRGDRTRRIHALAAISACVLVSLPYLGRYVAMVSAQRELMDDVLGRGNLQMKEPLHFLKHAFFMLTTLLLLGIVWRMSAFRRCARDYSPILLLVAAAFLPHFSSVFSGRTIVGLGYFFYASIVPWSFLCLVALLSARLSSHPWMRRENAWLFATFLMVVAETCWMAHQSRRLLTTADPHRSRRIACYEILRARTDLPKGAVVLTLNSSNELMLQLGAHPFLTSSLNQTYITSAPTEELLERYLLASLLLRGDLGPIPEILRENGLPLSTLEARLDPGQRRWLDLLRNCLGSNSFIFHPRKNRLDLQQKGITLPPHLRNLDSLVVYLAPRFHARIEKLRAEWERPLREGRAVSLPFRLDALLIPRDDLRAEGFLPRFARVIGREEPYLLFRLESDAVAAQPARRAGS